MIIYAPTGACRRGNRAFEELFGFTIEEMIGGNFCILE